MGFYDDLTISITCTSNEEMRRSVKSTRGWRFHHILPVRTYYMTAVLMLKLASNPDTGDTLHSLGRDTLQKMAREDSARSAIAAYIEQAREAGGATDAGLAPMAKRCTSPRWGGFLGPIKDQRSHDPHDLYEQNRPLSFRQTQWDSVIALRTAIQDAFSLTQAPAPTSTTTQTKKIKEWNDIGRTIGNHVRGAAIAAVDVNAHVPGRVLDPVFTPSDWRPDASPNWTLLPSDKIIQPETKGPKMRLRLATETDGYRDPATLGQAVPTAGAVTVLAQKGGFLYLAAP